MQPGLSGRSRNQTFRRPFLFPSPGNTVLRRECWPSLLDLRGWASWTTSFIYERRSAGASVGPNKSEHYPHGTSLISTTMIYNASSNSHNLHRLCRFTHITVSETVSSFPPGCCINLLGGYCTQLPMISLSLGRWKLLRTWIWGREEIPEINKYVLIKKYVQKPLKKWQR